jgi:hypothetical protein
MARIERLEVYDAFLHGQTYHGTLIGDDRLLTAIIEYRRLKRVEPAVPVDLHEPREKRIDYEDEHSWFSLNPEDGRIEFSYHEFGH